MMESVMAALGITVIITLCLLLTQGQINGDKQINGDTINNVIQNNYNDNYKNIDDRSHGDSDDRKCTVRHGITRHRIPCEAIDLPPSKLPENATVLQLDEFPTDERLLPELGNGHIATVVRGDSIFMNGLYNGKDVDSHRARIPSPVAVRVTAISPGQVTKKYVLDLGRGVYYEHYDGDGFYVELRLYAHRVITKAFVVEVIIAETSAGRNEEIRVDLQINNGSASEDITWTDVDDNGQITMKSGYTKEAEYPELAPVTPVSFISSNIPTNISLPLGISKEDVFFVTAISTKKSEAIDSWNQVMNLMVNGSVLSSHAVEWEGVWNRGRIDLEGNLTLSKLTYASLYYLTSSLPLKTDPNWSFVGLSPGGLAHGARGKDYNGHVFWDQDTWMFPPLMMLHSDLGRLIVGTRIRTLSAAAALAKSTGYKGVRYPWESAFTGLETSPSKACGDLEQHITGDVSFAFRQYMQLTNDTDFLTNGKGLEAITGMADFWASRVTYNNKTKMWEIKDVMPPDEYHANVDNSVYTNTVARLSLTTAIYYTSMAGQKPPGYWQQIADNMYIPFDDKLQYHPEYDGYKAGTVVKQADVVMLGFPLMSQSPQLQIQENDLLTYQKVTPGGPAMTWGIFTIGWLELKQKDKADILFKQTSLNARAPFYIWTENADGSGAVNFHTGMGGYLQAVIFGYGGFRIETSQLVFNPNLPPSTTRLSITGIDYGGNSLDLTADSVNMTITATSLSKPMEVTVFGMGVTDKLLLNQPRTYPRQKAALVMSNNSK